MFGESILAAPVVKEGATKWDVYLPTYGDTRGPTWLDGGSTTLVCNQGIRINASDQRKLKIISPICTYVCSMMKKMAALELGLTSTIKVDSESIIIY